MFSNKNYNRNEGNVKIEENDIKTSRNGEIQMIIGRKRKSERIRLSDENKKAKTGKTRELEENHMSLEEKARKVENLLGVIVNAFFKRVLSGEDVLASAALKENGLGGSARVFAWIAGDFFVWINFAFLNWDH